MIRRDTSRFIPPDALLFVALATIWGLSFVGFIEQTVWNAASLAVLLMAVTYVVTR